jgi:hypothetical protein
VTGNKFQNFSHLRERRDQSVDDPAGESVAAAVLPEPAAAPGPAPRKVRSPGKRQDPKYTQATVFLPAEAYREAKIRMYQRGRNGEVSDLLSALLTAWVQGDIEVVLD